MTEARICRICSIEKELSFFRKRKKKDGIYYDLFCKECGKLSNQKTVKKYCEENFDKINEYQRQYRKENEQHLKEQKHIHYMENKDKYNLRKSEWDRARRKSDPIFRMRRNVSGYILKYLKKNSSSKNGFSFLCYFNYTIQELKYHLEQQFEPWMNWRNQGRYDCKTWDDNDPSTWTWQIDHIIPHSTFKYSSMEDYAFRKCWALENLRPLSAKQNYLDGCTKIRHNIKESI